jgi:DNA repair exonuclease SbcCD ATPase subunit
MIKINNLTLKNFMSIGNNTQTVDFDRDDLTLVLGENLDLGGDGNRNGVGKTSILNALSYALYGQALSNIRRDNLVNKTNAKNMLVSLDFSVKDKNYRIIRGRKPNVLKFYVNDEEQKITDDAQGDSRETQQTIEQLLGISHDMFKHILTLNTYTEPFLSLRANDQRSIIEQLLGITQLSERAERIKDYSRETRESITQEEYRIRALIDSNKKIQEQIDSLKRKQNIWITQCQQEIKTLNDAIIELGKIDIEQEIQSHRELAEYQKKSKQIKDCQHYLELIDRDDQKQQKLLDQLKKELDVIEQHQCHTCGQEIHDSQQATLRESRQKLMQETALQLLTNQTQRIEHLDTIANIGDIGSPPEVFYDDIELALNHKNTLDNLVRDLENKQSTQDPYHDQISEMQSAALQEVSYDYLNDLTKLQEHQEFLLKLLTSKDSFIRKKIIDQNLAYLNSRLTHYLDRIGLPHVVKFQNDLSVSIEELGRELDFDNLSRGERNRLILSMSWAFRDVWESLYQPINLLFIDEMIDNGLDTQGVESSLALLKSMCRERGKSVWLVSHRDELIGRVSNVLKVVKTGGFTEYILSD